MEVMKDICETDIINDNKELSNIEKLKTTLEGRKQELEGSKKNLRKAEDDLTTAKTARVSLQMSGLDVIEGAAKDVEVPSRGEARVEWRVRAQQVRSVR